jgi:hypothetical protein
MTELLTRDPTQRVDAGHTREAGGTVVGQGDSWGTA